MVNFQEIITDRLRQELSDVKTRVFIFNDDTRITFTDISKSHIAVADKVGLCLEYFQFLKGRGGTGRSKFWQDLHKTLMDEKKEVKETPPENLTGYKLLVDKEGSKYKTHRLYDIQKKELYKITWAAFETVQKKDIKAVEADSVFCEFIFDPLKPRIEVDEDTGDWTYNTYTPPVWLSKDVEPKIPEIFETLFSHLFTDERSREYAMKWLYLSLVKRCPTYLVFCGIPGTGKGFFESIARGLVGYHNSDEPSEGFLKKEFNKSMESKKLLVLDEVVVTHKNKDKLKRYVNNLVSIEGKGSNAAESKRNHCSFIISRNGLSGTYLEWSDRRFAVMDITEQPLNTVLPDTQTEAMVNSLEEDPECLEIAQFGHYLKQRYDKKENVAVYPVFKGDLFYKLVEVSLYEWQKLITEEYVAGESEVAIRTLRKRSKERGVPFPANKFKIIDFLQNYRHGPEQVIIGEYGHDTQEIVFSGNVKKIEEEVQSFDTELL